MAIKKPKPIIAQVLYIKACIQVRSSVYIIQLKPFSFMRPSINLD